MPPPHAKQNRAAEVYVEPIKEPSPEPAKREPEPVSDPRPRSVVDETPVQPETKPIVVSPSPAQPVNLAGLLPSVEIIPHQTPFAVQTHAPPETASRPLPTTDGQAHHHQQQQRETGGMDLDPSELPTLDAGEMALFDFINSVANSPTAYESGTSHGNVNGNGNGNGNNDSDMGVGVGMNTGSGLGAGVVGLGLGGGTGEGLDFGLLEAGLQDEIARAAEGQGQGMTTSISTDVDMGADDKPVNVTLDPSGVPAQKGPVDSKVDNNPTPDVDPNSIVLDPASVQPTVDTSMDPNGNGNMDHLDLFSQYPDLFNFRGAQDYTGSGNDIGNNNNNTNNNNVDGVDGGNDSLGLGLHGDAAGGIEVFDADTFDYSMLDPNAFFADGMQGMEGM